MLTFMQQLAFSSRVATEQTEGEDRKVLSRVRRKHKAINLVKLKAEPL